MGAINVFRDAGWRSVKSGTSGVYEKNGFYLSLCKEARVYPGNKVVTDDSLSSAVLMYDVRGTTWHLEKDGWYLDGGKMDISLGEILQRVEKLVVLNDVELCAYKQHFVTKTRTESVLDGVAVNAKVTATLTFRVSEPYGAFVPDEVYAIINLVDDVMYVQRYNKGMTKLLKTVYPVTDVKGFFAANESGIVVTVRVQPNVKEVPYIELEPVIKASSVVLPAGLNARMSTQRKVAVGAAFAAAKDFSILLDSSYGDDCIASLTKLVDSGVNTSVFDGKGIQNDVLDKLVDLWISGKDVSRFMSAQSLSELSVLEADSNNFLGERESRLRSMHTDYGVMRALARFAYTPGIEKYANCRNEPEVYLRKRADEGGDHAVIDALLSYGILTEDKLTCNWYPLNRGVKTFMRRYLNAQDLVFKGASWNYWLDRFISASTALYYSYDTGYCLSYGGYLIGRNHHSVFVLKTREKPVWRATFVNNEWIATESMEMDIDM